MSLEGAAAGPGRQGHNDDGINVKTVYSHEAGKKRFMAKTRVTHLAKEFQMDVKELMQRLKDINIEVENYLSSIDEDEVARARAVLARTIPQVEEQRIGSNIKRRRRAAPAAADVTAPPPPAAEGETPTAAPEAVMTAAAPPPLAEAESTEAPEPAVPRRRKAGAKAARIVALPEISPLEETAAPPVAETLPAEPVAAPPVTPESAPSVAEEVLEVAEASPPPAAVEPPVAPAPEEAAAAPPEAPAEAPAEAKVAAAPDASAALRRQKAKKLKKETPARIISLPPEEPPAAPKPEAPKAAPRPRVIEISKPKEEAAATPAKEAPGAARGKKKGGKRPGAAAEEAAKKKGGRKKEVREGADLYEVESEAAGGKKKGVKKAVRKLGKTELTVPKAIKRRIKVGDSITVGELAKRMGIKFGEIAKKLMGLGIMANINYPIDFDTSVLVANEFGYEVERASLHEEDIMELRPQEQGELAPRPPVVTIMGHVDHGKTSLLDAIRESRVIETEAGGITQHIGAYHVSLPKGDVVFLDTPGHEAFTAMRARGAQVTDLVVLVVAADDGVMPQTMEAINHAKAAHVPLVVAVNKIDKPNANPDRVKQELSGHGVIPEEWGGDVQFAEISAKQRLGIDELLEKILLQAEILELQAVPDSLARGRIIEAKLDKGRGPVGTVLVQNGTLHTGDGFVCGVEYGKVRAMFDDRGQRVEVATPATPVEVQGFSGVPNAGDEFLVLENDRVAKQVAQMRQQKQREATMAKMSKVTLEKLYQRFKEGEVKELNLVIKADVQGSLEALTKALSELGTEEIKVSIIHTGAGDINETDVMLASASNAIVIGFNVRMHTNAQTLAEQEQVDVRFYDIIYNLVTDISSALEGLLEPIFEERLAGKAEVRQVFSIPKIGLIAGCGVLEGKVERNGLVKVVRDGKVVFEGKVSSLKRFKEDVKEVAAGYECGIGLEKYDDLKAGDLLEFYTLVEVKPTLESLGGRSDAAPGAEKP